jgi:hypothetical protein
MAQRVYVGGLPQDISERDLEEKVGASVRARHGGLHARSRASLAGRLPPACCMPKAQGPAARSPHPTLSLAATAACAMCGWPGSPRALVSRARRCRRARLSALHGCWHSRAANALHGCLRLRAARPCSAPATPLDTSVPADAVRFAFAPCAPCLAAFIEFEDGRDAEEAVKAIDGV